MSRVGRRVATALLAAGLVGASVCAAALGGTVAVERFADGRVGVVFRGGPGPSGEGVELSSSTDRIWRLRSSTGPALAGEGCTAPAFDTAECELPDGVPAGPAVVYGSGRYDQVDLHLVSAPVLVYGFAGGDKITSGELLDEDTVAVAPPGSEIFGGPGDDSLNEFGIDWGNRQRWPPESCRNRRALFGAKLNGGSGRDRVCDTAGDDLLVVRDGQPDVAGCTDGRDVILADRFDFVGGECERIARPGRYGAAAFGLYNNYSELDAGAFMEVYVGCNADGPRFCAAKIRLNKPGRGGRLLARQQFGLARGEMFVLIFDFPEETVERLARTGVRATVLTDPPSGRKIRTSRLLDVRPMIPDDD